jgi:hypothetical protein
MIVWGTKIIRKKAGFTLRFCPICRDLRAFQIVEVASKQHIYFIALGRRTPILTELVCTDCKSVLAQERFEGTRTDEPAANPQAALARLFPAEADPIKAQLKNHAAVMAPGAALDTRVAAAAEPFFALTYEFETAKQRGAEASISALLAAGSIFGFIASAVLWVQVSETHRPGALLLWAIGVSVVTLALIGVTFYRNFTRDRRLMEKSFLGRLARSLLVMKATPSEYAVVHAMLSDGKQPVAMAVKPETLRAAVEGRGVVV